MREGEGDDSFAKVRSLSSYRKPTKIENMKRNMREREDRERTVPQK